MPAEMVMLQIPAGEVTLAGRSGNSEKRARARLICAWQREQPAQPAQSGGRRSVARCGNGDAALRSAHAGGRSAKTLTPVICVSISDCLVGDWRS